MEQDSWQLYIMLVSAVVGVYYIYVGVRFYRSDLQNVVTRVLKPPNTREAETIQVTELEALNQAARLLEESFDGLAGIEITHQEVLSFAREQLSGIPGLENSVVRQTLEQLVASKSKTVFGLELSHSDLKTIW